MGTILFVILRLAGLFNTRIDFVLLCFLVALDTAGLASLIKVLRR